MKIKNITADFRKSVSSGSVLLALLIILFYPAAKINAQTCSAAPTVSIIGNTAPANNTAFAIPSASGINIYNSAETGRDTIATETTADGYDAAWRTGATATGVSGFSTPWTGGSAGSFTNGMTLFTSNGLSVSFSSVNMDAALETGSHPCAGTSNTGNPTLSGSGGSVIQDSSPRPARLVGTGTYMDASNVGSSASRNAFLFRFSAAPKAFGAWFGDVETRTDGFGRPAIVRLLDANDNRIGSDIIINTSTAPAAQINCDSANGGASEPANYSAVVIDGCGSRTTRWLGFVDTNAVPAVRAMVVIVGDADAGNPSAGNPNGFNGTSDGGTEFLSFIGATLPATTTAACVSVSGRVMTAKGRGIEGSRIQAVNTNTGEIQYTFSTFDGSFQFNDLLVGDFYIFGIRDKRYNFGNFEQGFQLFEGRDDLIFTPLR